MPEANRVSVGSPSSNQPDPPAPLSCRQTFACAGDQRPPTCKPQVHGGPARSGRGKMDLEFRNRGRGEESQSRGLRLEKGEDIKIIAPSVGLIG